MQRVRHANRGRLLLRTPGPVPLWDLHVFLCRDQSLLNLSCLRTFEFRTPLGTSLLPSSDVECIIVWENYSQNGPNPKRLRSKRPKSETAQSKTAQLFWSKRPIFFIFIGNGFNLRIPGKYFPPPFVETISYPCATPLLYSQNTCQYKLLLY